MNKEDDPRFEEFARELQAKATDGLVIQHLLNGASITISMTGIWMMMVSLQLSLKHPHNKGETAVRVRRLLDWLESEFLEPGSIGREVFREGYEGAEWIH